MHMYPLQICVCEGSFLEDISTAACLGPVPSQYSTKGVKSQAPTWSPLSTLCITVQPRSWGSCWWDYDKLQGVCILQTVSEGKVYSLGDQGVYPGWESDRIYQVPLTILWKGYLHPSKLAAAFNKSHLHTVTTTIRQEPCLVLWPVLYLSRTGCGTWETRHLPHRHHNDQ